VRTIHKIVLNVVDDQWITIPKGSVILSVGEQREAICLWFGCETNEPELETRHISIFGTGNPIPDGPLGTFLGTVIAFGGALVWHVFDRDDQ
jgi:hypothetical protein